MLYLLSYDWPLNIIAYSISYGILKTNHYWPAIKEIVCKEISVTVTVACIWVVGSMSKKSSVGKRSMGTLVNFCFVMTTNVKTAQINNKMRSISSLYMTNKTIDPIFLLNTIINWCQAEIYPISVIKLWKENEPGLPPKSFLNYVLLWINFQK